MVKGQGQEQGETDGLEKERRRKGGMKELGDRKKQRQRHRKETRVERQERSTDRKSEVR